MCQPEILEPGGQDPESPNTRRTAPPLKSSAISTFAFVGRAVEGCLKQDGCWDVGFGAGQCRASETSPPQVTALYESQKPLNRMR